MGLRSRLRALLSPPPDPRVALTFVLPDGSERVVLCLRGETALRASARLPVGLHGPCADQRCGDCAVVPEGGAAVLGCQLRVEAPARLRVVHLWSMDQIRGG